MIEQGTWLAALAVGFLGGVHCVGMCGGIVGALSFGLPQGTRTGLAAQWPFLLAYNAGRIGSYALVGALAGGFGWFAANLVAVNAAQTVLSALAGLFMIALGFYLAGWWRGLARIERAGGAVWRKLEPFGRRLMPVRTTAQALRLGIIWGWLPCGLVYSVLVWTLTAGGAAEGALLMAAFGLGTLPNLLVMGVFAARLAGFVRRPLVKGIAGGLVAAWGVLMLVRGLIVWPAS